MIAASRIAFLAAVSMTPALCVAQQLPSLPSPAAQMFAQSVKPGTPLQTDTSATVGQQLTLAQAEQLAMARNPDITVAQLLALAQQQVTRETRSAELPQAIAALTAADAHADSRLTAGELNNPIVYQRAAGGLSVRQLLTDFGRTHNLIRSAQSDANAKMEMQRATADDLRLAVDQAFFQALTAHAVVKVAQQTLSTRQTTVEQIQALTQSKLRSTLDLSLAEVQASQAQLLLLDAQSDEQAAMANLNALMGSETDEAYNLADPTTASPEPAPVNVEELVQVAIRNRPDLTALRDQQAAAKQFASAEHALWRPTISALAVVGGTPVRADQIQSSWYGAAGANVSIPVFNGFAYSARAKEADLRARAATEQVRGLRDTIGRDVRIAVLNAQRAFQRITVSQQLLAQASNALELAQARYRVGLSGIVDLTQAQLAQTSALIDYTNARYAYQTATAEIRFQTGQ